MPNHRWIKNVCTICGCTREKKVQIILTTTSPQNHYHHSNEYFYTLNNYKGWDRPNCLKIKK